MKLETLMTNVYQWSKVRGIHEESDQDAQVQKFCEELGEYLTLSSVEEGMDAIGDMVVCLINAQYFEGEEYWYPGDLSCETIADVVNAVDSGQYMFAISLLKGLCDWHDWDFEECLQIAWDEIKHRRGLMIDKKFVKWENLNDEQRTEVERREAEAKYS